MSQAPAPPPTAAIQRLDQLEAEVAALQTAYHGLVEIIERLIDALAAEAIARQRKEAPDTSTQ